MRVIITYRYMYVLLFHDAIPAYIEYPYWLKLQWGLPTEKYTIQHISLYQNTLANKSNSTTELEFIFYFYIFGTKMASINSKLAILYQLCNEIAPLVIRICLICCWQGGTVVLLRSNALYNFSEKVNSQISLMKNY